MRLDTKRFPLLPSLDALVVVISRVYNPDIYVLNKHVWF